MQLGHTPRFWHENATSISWSHEVQRTCAKPSGKVPAREVPAEFVFDVLWEWRGVVVAGVLKEVLEVLRDELVKHRAGRLPRSVGGFGVRHAPRLLAKGLPRSGTRKREVSPARGWPGQIFGGHGHPPSAGGGHAYYGAPKPGVDGSTTGRGWKHDRAWMEARPGVGVLQESGPRKWGRMRDDRHTSPVPIEHVFGEWRRASSTCAGGLVWFLRDLWPGAGWGVIGADGTPKAAYSYLRRALAPIALHVSDEGSNGLYIHAFNDADAPLDGELEIALYRVEAKVGHGARSVHVPARGALEVPALSLFDGFMDLGHAYRFGPPTCDLVVATLWVGGRTFEAFHFPLGLPAVRGNPGISAEVAPCAGGEMDLTIRTRGFAQSVAVELGGFAPDDDFFHLAPGGARTVRLRPTAAGSAGSGRVNVLALNAESLVSVAIPRT